jgi:hypothetical protein
MPTFTADEVADHWISYNQGWDILFRVLVLVLSLATTVLSLISANTHDAPPVLATTSAVLAGIVTLVSAFAFSTLDFATRQRGWTTKTNAWRALIDQLNFAEPDKKQFLARKGDVHAYNADRGGELKPWQPA